MWLAIGTVSLLALVAGLGLGIANRRLIVSGDDVVETVNRLLPQTQCAQCGFPGCRPYAEAVVNDAAPINLCPPGGDETIRRLALTLGRDIVPLSAELNAVPARSVAVIDEQRCIGCLHCRNACPVDAIVGAQQFMHTVIGSECTGCELCIDPCPVDCITLEPVH